MRGANGGQGTTDCPTPFNGVPFLIGFLPVSVCAPRIKGSDSSCFLGEIERVDAE